MVLRIVRPAPIHELSQVLASDGLPPHLNPMRLARVYTTSGRSWGYLDETGACVACAGLFTTLDGRMEAWFSARSGASRHMLSFVKTSQLTIRNVLQNDPRPLFTQVMAGHRPGQRIAQALGFRFAGMVGGVEQWTWNAPGANDKATA